MVVVEPGAEGFGEMLAEIVRANLERDPARHALLRAPAAGVNVHASDAGVGVGIVFGAGQFRVVGPPLVRADLEITADAETLMALTSVPLRGGLPDVTTEAGRAVSAKMLRGELKVRGMVGGLGTLTRLNRLLSVA